jgi:hypothetical protein
VGGVGPSRNIYKPSRNGEGTGGGRPLTPNSPRPLQEGAGTRGRAVRGGRALQRASKTPEGVLLVQNCAWAWPRQCLPLTCGVMGGSLVRSLARLELPLLVAEAELEGPPGRWGPTLLPGSGSGPDPPPPPQKGLPGAPPPDPHRGGRL